MLKFKADGFSRPACVSMPHAHRGHEMFGQFSKLWSRFGAPKKHDTHACEKDLENLRIYGPRLLELGPSKEPAVRIGTNWSN